MKLNFLEKTELWIENVELDNVNLTDLSNRLADILGVEYSKVLVVDVRETHITFDILERFVDAERFFGKKKEIFQELSRVDGFKLTDSSDIHSDGILGMVSLEESEVADVIKRMEEMTSEIQEKVKKRAIVFPTGFEVKKGYIEDTNTPYIRKKLEEYSYRVSLGDVLDDDERHIASKLSNAVLEGYGLIIITGDVGAEDKDKTVEAILRIDANASTPYIVKFRRGSGRHVKDGVKIAVGKSGQALIVALPGPNDEVIIGMEELLKGLNSGLDKEGIATLIANALSKKLIQKKQYSHH